MRHRFLQGVVMLAVVAALAGIVWLAHGPGERTVHPGPAPVSAARGEPGSEPISAPLSAPPSRRDTPPNPAPTSAPSDAPASNLSSEPYDEMAAAAWAAVDMEEVRKAMPDNLYWKLSVPTKDPQVLAEREAERARWNVEYGKILSGTASEDEIRAYYDNRARLSGDYIEFVTYLLDHYEGTLPERDVSMLKLALRLHRARLEEIPRKVEEALERKWEQDAAREAWLKDQATFGGADSDSAADANAE
jgi:hypothetical protein